ncbi:MAG: GNAT family N-acetyltransferase [Pseudomonadota bacterium]
MTEPRRRVTAETWRDYPETDLFLELPGALVLALDWLDWDSRFFGLPCYRLFAGDCRVCDGAVDTGALMMAAAQFPRCAVWAKVPPQAPPALTEAIQALGGKFIETELTLGHNGTAAAPATVAGVKIREADTLARTGFLELGRTFSLTRFHTDPRIGKDRADALWTEYLRNFRLSPDRRAFLAEADGRIVGAVLASAGDAVNVIDIVAVAPAFAGRGIGRALLQASLSWSIATGRGCTVATQHRNTGAIAFYRKNGFGRLESATPVFHLWTADRVGAS